MKPYYKKRKSTDIEIYMESLLDALNIKFKKEFKVGNYPVDFYLPEYKLTIQTDGCWVHNHKGCKNNSTYKKYPRQVFQERRDRACVSYHNYMKVNILRIRECSLKNKPDIVISEIQYSIESIRLGNYISKTI